jgi:hypothetical protein
MLLLAKGALGIGGTLVLVAAYTFHEGVIRVDADESRTGGAHAHFWLPAAAIPMFLRLVPSHEVEKLASRARFWLPTFHVMTKELKKYGEAELIEVRDGEKSVHVRTHDGKLLIDVDEPGQTAHVACPLATLEDISQQLEKSAPPM